MTTALEPDDRELVASILAYIDGLCERKGFEEVAEELEVASQCIRSSFESEIEKVQEQEKAPSLLQIFKAGREALKTPTATAPESASSPTPTGAAGPTPAAAAAASAVPGVPDKTVAAIASDPQFQKYITTISTKNFFEGHAEGSPEYKIRYDRAVLKYLDHFKKMGDNLKAKGNALMGKKDYSGALEQYKKAISTCRHSPNAYMYYGNAAAARLNIKDYEGAEEDCRAGIALKDDYAKLYKRLATACEGQKKYAEAAANYNRAADLDPKHADDYRELKERAERRAAAAAAMPPPLPAASGAGMPGMGGMGGMMSMLNNPEMMRTAQSMMQNPEFMGMAQNMMANMGGQEGIQKMMAGMGGPAGLASMMNGMGGGGGPAGGAPAGVDPAMMERLSSSPGMAELRSDPEMAAFSEDLQNGGPAAALKHMSNPKVMQKIMAAMPFKPDDDKEPES